MPRRGSSAASGAPRGRGEQAVVGGGQLAQAERPRTGAPPIIPYTISSGAIHGVVNDRRGEANRGGNDDEARDGERGARNVPATRHPA